jgi:hypothetical protein
LAANRSNCILHALVCISAGRVAPGS